VGDFGKSRAALLREIAELRERNRQLVAEREAGYRVLLERASVLVWTTDTEFRCTSMAGGALKRLGLAPGEQVGVSVYEYFGSVDPNSPPIEAHHQAILGGSKSYEFTFAGVTAQCHVEPLYDEEGGIVGVIGVAIDVTDRAQAEAESARLMEDLHAALHERRPLGELVKICADCKRIRDDDGRWVSLERFLADRTKARFTHGLCSRCVGASEVDGQS
jgi:PAS domain S-box-containing protein